MHFGSLLAFYCPPVHFYLRFASSLLTPACTASVILYDAHRVGVYPERSPECNRRAEPKGYKCCIIPHCERRSLPCFIFFHFLFAPWCLCGIQYFPSVALGLRSKTTTNFDQMRRGLGAKILIFKNFYLFTTQALAFF